MKKELLQEKQEIRKSLITTINMGQIVIISLIIINILILIWHNILFLLLEIIMLCYIYYMTIKGKKKLNKKQKEELELINNEKEI